MRAKLKENLLNLHNAHPKASELSPGVYRMLCKEADLEKEAKRKKELELQERDRARAATAENERKKRDRLDYSRWDAINYSDDSD